MLSSSSGFFSSLLSIDSIAKALDRLDNILFYSTSPLVRKAINVCIDSHAGQFRKSGIPYAVHPICVACIIAYYGAKEAMICAALLHDVIEDTAYTMSELEEEFGHDIASLVDALTKIVEIRKGELNAQDNVITNNKQEDDLGGELASNLQIEEENKLEDKPDKMIYSALSFRKMLLASIRDVRALVIKISDRVHNMLTLDALDPSKQIQIAEETLVVYAPIAHRLGISSIKNELEDRSFYYIFPKEYHEIQEYLNTYRQNLELKLNKFISKISSLLMKSGFLETDFMLEGRIKRPYSIYLKRQKKGVSIDEILDLLAIRVILNESIDCYKVLGIVHLNFKPIISRFKDYVSLPKENGYQTIHTTVFDESSIFEVQIRTAEMNNAAEFGVAAHWKYKHSGVNPSMDWLDNLGYQDNSAKEFYELAKNDLYREDVLVFSPAGDTYTLPRGATALDFAYAIHSELGNYAKDAHINNMSSSLLTVLKSGDIVRIVRGDSVSLKCTWIDMVKTSKAKQALKLHCSSKIKDIDQKSAINILATIFNKDINEIYNSVLTNHLENLLVKSVRDIATLKDLISRLKNIYRQDANLFKKLQSIASFSSLDRIKIKDYVFDNLVVYSSGNISDLLFDYCCRPKHQDEVLAIRRGSKAFVHHKLCERALKEVNEGARMLFVEWKDGNSTSYKAIVALENQRGALASFLNILNRFNCNVLGVSYDSHKNQLSPTCEVIFETTLGDVRPLKYALNKKHNVIEFFSLKDAYQNSL